MTQGNDKDGGQIDLSYRHALHLKTFGLNGSVYNGFQKTLKLIQLLLILIGRGVQRNSKRGGARLLSKKPKKGVRRTSPPHLFAPMLIEYINVSK